MTTSQEIIEAISKLANPEKTKVFLRFFKTGKGQYGEGDKFLGLTVPEQRGIVKEFKNEIVLSDLEVLINSQYHEHRLVALLLLIELFKQSKKQADKKKFLDFYLSHTNQINNWDLVDLSAPKIIGQYYFENEKNKNKTPKKLIALAKSKNLWEKRIAIVATYAFIRNNIFEPTLELAEILVNDSHDLIHKAVGWMLREIGKRDQNIEEKFLDKHYKTMPRTMLRYSIERFSPRKRSHYMGK